ncbi:histidinol-phosphate transaminase [Clostridium oceanicum]|uniref:Histidinol-phosphate transaminase n=1 Tax=Clostridium oceanicum TaxID=1543 RepID=A0ABN1JGE6_9CLOT
MHGGDIYTEGILKGKNLIDFSSNINPLGVPESLKENINEVLENVKVYPDIKYRSLKNNIINYLDSFYKYFGFNKKDDLIKFENEDIVLGNGAIEIIDLSISLFNSITIVVPSFVEYKDCSKKWGLNINYSKLNGDMTYNYENIKESLKNSDALIIANPNNPSGNVIDKDKFKAVLEFAEKNNKTIIIDEAFVEFTGKKNISLLNLCSKYKCIIIIRALTKFFALPGVRFGYGITKNKNLIKKIKEKQNPWNINSLAEVAVNYVLKDEKYINKSIEYIEKEREFILKNLREINIFEKVYKTNSNFVLCKLKNLKSGYIKDVLLKSGIVIRECFDFETLDENYIRFAIKSRENNNKLISLLKNI